MWAADFHQATAWAFEYHSLEALRLPNFNSPTKIYPLQEGESCRDSFPDILTPPSPERLHRASSGSPCLDSVRWRTIAKRRSFCGLRPGRLWQINRNRLNSTNIGLSGPDGDQDISVFCVAAIMEQNRGMLMEKLQSMDDAIKVSACETCSQSTFTYIPSIHCKVIVSCHVLVTLFLLEAELRRGGLSSGAVLVI